MTDAKLFAVPLGTPFAKAFVDGYIERNRAKPPHVSASSVIIANSGSMARALRAAFVERAPILVPRIITVAQVEDLAPNIDVPMSVDPLRLRLELTQLTARLAETSDPDAGQSAYAIAGTLQRLLAEMASEGVTVDSLASLDVSGHSAYWQRNLAFIELIQPFLTGDTIVDAETRQRLVVDALITEWQESPPPNPVYLVGSTGSRGTTRRLMEALAKLKNGYVVLPGFDWCLPDQVRSKLGDDHPQFRFHDLMGALDLRPADVAHWSGSPAAPDRQSVLSLALRPPPVTDQWVKEGASLPNLADALSDVTLLEAATPQLESQAIALGMRDAVEQGKRVALVTPDRTLTRRVTAALDRWSIEPDDSAGRPLALSAPGRLLRQISTLTQPDLPCAEILALLKHPLVSTQEDRGTHLLMVRELEIWIRRKGHAFLTSEILRAWAGDAQPRRAWVVWVKAAIPSTPFDTPLPLQDALDRLLTAATALARGGSDTGSGELWLKTAGQMARARMDDLYAAADASRAVTKSEFKEILASVLQDEVRSAVLPHEDVIIRGTLEARTLDADLVILAGLNEKSWPAADDHDPWLNRALRRQAGLLTHDRATGLAAHDFEQAFGAPEVWLSRAINTDEGETVPSRWLNRLKNLVSGLPSRGGNTALRAMSERGAYWLHAAQQIDRRHPKLVPAPRPAPAPPPNVRPTRLSVTEIQTLIRDPYAIYAKHVLGLSRLEQPPDAPDARLRGIALHDVADRFSRQDLSDSLADNTARLLQTAKDVFEAMVPWPVTRQLWLARLARVAPEIIEGEVIRQSQGTIAHREVKAELTIDVPVFTLVGKADRIDRQKNGALAIYDYKSGKPPTSEQIKYFDKQLPLEAWMVSQGAFGPETRVDHVGYIGLGANCSFETLGFGPESAIGIDLDTVSREFVDLLLKYLDPARGFPSRRRLEKIEYRGDFDHLARYGEWDEADTPDTLRVGS